VAVCLVRQETAGSQKRTRAARRGRGEHCTDLAFVSVTIVGKDGWKVPTARNLVRFGVSGPGTIAAVGRGGEPHEPSVLPIQITAELEALASGSIVVMSRE